MEQIMAQEDRDLLLKDLCGRLPYGVKVQVQGYVEDVETIETLREIDSDGYISTLECDTLKNIYKPYLFPLSSMTEEQHKEFYDKYCWSDGGDNFEMDSCSHSYALEKFDWLDKNHFDYRGLIPRGLALDATNLGIY